MSLEQAVAAPLASRHLADLGARVIKVERPGVGDLARSYDRTVHGQSSHFVWLNRGKESIELDLKREADSSTLWKLIDRADVVIQNLAPGAFERLGFGTANLRARRPGLITCDISGYGSGGPYGDKKAYDLLIQCEAGLVSITGTEEVPSKAGISIADIATGMYAFSGVLTALYERQMTGEGASLEVSMLEALGEWMGYPYLYAAYGGTPPPRAGASHATIAPYGPYETFEGTTINIGLQNEREWASFCTAFLERPDLIADKRFAANPERVANRVALDIELRKVFASLSSEVAAARLDAAGVAWAIQRDMAGFFRHPQLRARERFQAIETPGGRVEMTLPPVTVSGRHPVLGDVPALGHDTAAVHMWLEQENQSLTTARRHHEQ